MTKEFKLSEKECNILTSEQLDDVELYSQDIKFVDGTNAGKEIIFHNGENIMFKKGYFKEDVKEFIRELKEIFYAGNSHMRIDKLAGDKLI